MIVKMMKLVDNKLAFAYIILNKIAYTYKELQFDYNTLTIACANNCNINKKIYKIFNFWGSGNTIVSVLCCLSITQLFVQS